MALFDGLAPYDTQPLLIAAFVLAALIYARGLGRRRRRQDIGPALAFYLGLAGLYAFTQTHLDYLARYVFFIHRIQHLELHHIGPFLIALSAPAGVLAAGLPARIRRTLKRLWHIPIVHGFYRGVQQPIVASVIFVGLIAFWLWPPVHFRAMLSQTDYWVMNLSMIVDGLAFWWFMLDPRPPGSTATTHSIGVRIGVLWAVMAGQIAIAAPIALATHEIYTSYAVCGRAITIDPLTDQQLGGLITWIPAAMMSVIGTLILLRFAFMHARTTPPLPRDTAS